ncbi:hypothetical protein G6514_001762 [Epicoccum nigrum]|nr:hypothetical protein G6514_001762 [Epicoccum nigrum]
MSFTTSPMSSTTGISPSVASHDMSFSSYDVSAPVHGNANQQKDMSLFSTTNDLSSLPTRRTRSAKSALTSAASTSNLAPGSRQKRKSTSQIRLSDEPQTKSEQQQLALAKLSKTEINLEQIVQQVLEAQQNQAGNRRGSNVLSETEKLHASQAIAEILKQKSTSTRSPQRRLTQGSASVARQYCDHSDCRFTGRPCDLKKHKKRHAKPYGCTYPKCHKRFGAKSDWKRHENSQHFQLEAFHCDQLNSSGQKCGQHCHRSSDFQKHLAKHGITAKIQVDVVLQRCKIGKNCQVQFWCGFCQKIEPLKAKRNAAWDERFDHIARHFEKENRLIDDWLCVEGNRTKGELQEEVPLDRKTFPDETDDTEMDAEGDDDDASPITQEGWPSTIRGASESPMQVTPQQQDNLMRGPKPSTYYWICVGGSVPVYMAIANSIV